MSLTARLFIPLIIGLSVAYGLLLLGDVIYVMNATDTAANRSKSDGSGFLYFLVSRYGLILGVILSIVTPLALTDPAFDLADRPTCVFSASLTGFGIFCLVVSANWGPITNIGYNPIHWKTAQLVLIGLSFIPSTVGMVWIIMTQRRRVEIIPPKRRIY